MNVLTAQQFLDQGTSASQVLSISKFLAHPARRRLNDAAVLRNIAMKLSVMTGESLHRERKPYAQNNNRRRHASNDNRKTRTNHFRRANHSQNRAPVRFGFGLTA